jgi:tRNA threonylcarbamoyladenosine biosynthesis protein TsaB
VRILALDTATENCSAALLIEGRLLAREQLLGRGHAERILPMVDELLREARLALRELSAIAFGRGPGAFTGVRLAASVAQGLAFGAGLPVVPVSDLRALAQRALERDPAAARVLVCNDARMHELYWGCFERGTAGVASGEALTAGVAVGVGDEHVGPPEGVRLPAVWSAPPAVQAAGTGFAAYPELRSLLAGRVSRFHEDLLPRAEEIARLAAIEVTAGRTVPAEEALPVYLREEVVHSRGHRH